MEAKVDPEVLEKGLKVVEKMTFNFDWTQYSEKYSKELRNLSKEGLGEEIIPEIKAPETRSLEAELDKMLAMVDENEDRAMLAKLESLDVNLEGVWISEPKYDGERILAEAKDKNWTVDRRHVQVSRKFPEVVTALLKVEGDDWVLDGN